ncbi:MAG TPA: hypothetical protein VJ184_09380 [Chryseolinea sp.]|nr:hypothetical protein [Chryseolinea sp.]
MSRAILDHIKRYTELTHEEEEYFLSILKPRKHLKRELVGAIFLQATESVKQKACVVRLPDKQYAENLFLDYGQNTET